MQTVTEFIGRCAAAPAELNSANRKIVAAAALTVTTAVRLEISAATHGTNRLRGVGRKGAKVGVGYDIKGAANPTALVAARGPLHLLERDTKPHPIAPRRRRGRRALAGDGFGPVSSVSQHPGSKGKHPFERGVTSSLPVAVKEAQAMLSAAVVEIVKG